MLRLMDLVYISVQVALFLVEDSATVQQLLKNIIKPIEEK
jgi:hypothetical protein